MDQTDDIISPEDKTAATVNHHTADAAMTEVETWLRQGEVSRAIPEAILIVDGTGTIIAVNSSCERMFGYHDSEVIGHSPEMLLPAYIWTPHTERYMDELGVRGMEDVTCKATPKTAPYSKSG